MSSDDDSKLSEARERADLARSRFVHALTLARQRVAPNRLKDDLMVAASDRLDDVRAQARNSLRRHPLMSSSAVVGIFALILWRPARQFARIGLRLGGLAWTYRNLWRPKNDRARPGQRA